MNKIILILITISVIFLFKSLDAGINYSGFSVATTDDFFATAVNPAALSFGNAEGVGFVQYYEKDKFRNIHSLIFNFKNLGYVYENLLDSTFHSIVLCSELGNSNIYLGSNYDWKSDKWKKGKWKLSLLFRPWDFLSFGARGIRLNSGDSKTRIGLGLRPISYGNTYWNRITITGDIDYFDKKWKKPIIGIESELINGIQLNSTFDFEKEVMSLGLNINISKFKAGSKIYVNKDYCDNYNGICYFNLSKSKFRSIFIKDKKNKFYNYKLKGEILEQKRINKFGLFQVITTKEMTISQVLNTIKELQEDDKVQGIVFQSGNILTDIATYEEIKDALIRFKSSGKKIVYYFDYALNMNYVLAAAVGDRIYLNPAGAVDLHGLHITVPYLNSLLDTLGIDIINFRSHDYKNAGNIFSESEMSEAEKEMYQNMLTSLYEQYVAMVASGRNMTEEHVKKLIDEGPYFIAKDALTANLIDDVIYKDELEEKIKKEFKEPQIVDNYKEKPFEYNWSEEYKKKIAVIYATGNIHYGKWMPGRSIGAETMARTIRKIRENESIKGIILRIDSGGGSALASEIIHREIELCRTGDKAKPVVVSMGGAAASGGYHIACEADKIIAEPATITGSIGVIAVVPNLTRLFEKIRINFDTVKKGKNADIGSLSRPMKESEKKHIEKAIEYSYWEFVHDVAKGRNMTRDEVHKIAQGRVWTGEQGKKLGLVDELGGLNKAVKVIKKLCKIKDDEEVELLKYPKLPTSFFKISFDMYDQKSKLKKIPQNFRQLINLFETSYLYQDEYILYLMPYKIPTKLE